MQHLDHVINVAKNGFQKTMIQPDKERQEKSIKEQIRKFMVTPRKTEDHVRRKWKFSLWYFVITILVIMLIQNYMISKHIETIPYSQFKQYVIKGKVKDLAIRPDDISGIITEDIKGRKDIPFVTVRVEDRELIPLLDKYRISYSGHHESKWITTFLSWVIPLILFFALWSLLIRRMGGGAGVLSVGKAKPKIYAESEVNIKFDDVAGIDEAKAELQEVVEFLKNPEKFRHLGARIPKGVLLVGPPGTGKTLLARAVAGEAKVHFFSLSGTDFVEMFVGVGAARVRDLFAQAKNNAPCIIFIDELDALGKARAIAPIAGGHEEREHTLNQLLVEMDGFDPTSGVIIMGATNRPEILDPALLRPGRFDRHVAIDRPDIKGRAAILRIHAKGIKLAEDVDLDKIAAMTPGFVGADLANLVNEAALLAARHNKDRVGMSEFGEAIDRIVGGLEKKSRVMNKKEKEIVAYHESGHALVANSLPTTEPVQKISIIPRGIAALGYTRQLPTEDRYLMTLNELKDRLCVLLGGRVAEEIIFGDISTGAQSDLLRATDIARTMVAEYGMSKRLGLASYAKEKRPLFLDTGLAPIKEYSEEKAREIDEEVDHLLEEAYQRVKGILAERKDKLHKVAKSLLEKEVLEGEELKALLV